MTRGLVPTPSRRLLLGAGGALFTPSVLLAADRPLIIEVDADQAPQLASAGEEIKRRAFSWWRIINEALASPGYRPPEKVTLRFTNGLPANIAGREVQAGEAVIELNAAYVAAHPITTNPQFYNYVGHEMVHVVQTYPHPTRWLVEGIADWVRYYVLFPQDVARFFNPRDGDYGRGYQPAAALLDYVERTHGVGSVRKLNAAMRAGENGEVVLAQIAGMSLNEVWAKVLDALTEGSPVPRA
jgi:hypothetical protein